jgi:ATP/maltotriose-dependent transcriptional regulator MalT
MQQHPHLATKLHIPPTRPKLVSRPRLLERLNAALPSRGTPTHRRDRVPRTRDAFARALTLISAPAGFGKTTFLSDWAESLHLNALQNAQSENRRTKSVHRVAWLSLDEGDNDLTRFLSFVIAALRTPSLTAGRTSGTEGPVLREAVTGHDGGQAILEMLERTDLFIVPPDQECRWYRSRQLFSDLLHHRLRQTQLGQLSTLHVRASE